MAERRGRCGHAGCLCDGFVKNRGMPGICARCRHRFAEHSTDVESQEDRTARKEAEAEQARTHLLEHIEKAKNSRGEARAARWREMLPPADEEWQTLTLRKTDERTRLVDVDGASSEFQQISLRKTATTQPVADRSAPKAFSSPRPPSGATSSVPMEPTAPREAGPEAAPSLAFFDATDIVSMQQALNECCEASGLLPYTNDRYPDLKERLVRQLNYADRQIFETLDAKLVRPPSQDASSLRVAVVGGGPVGLRTALELALCGAKVWVIEKRQHFNRLNILHLWEWVCTDLLNLGRRAPTSWAVPSSTSVRVSCSCSSRKRSCCLAGSCSRAASIMALKKLRLMQPQSMNAERRPSMSAIAAARRALLVRSTCGACAS